MSGQWEVVSRNKKDKTNNQNGKNHKKNNGRMEIPPPKVEDVLPIPHVKKLFSLDGKQDKKVAAEPEKTKKPKDNAKKQTVKKQEKQQDPPKTKPAKSIESALNNINVKDFETSLETSKRLTENPLLWLAELATFLNQKIIVEVNDPVFSNKAITYPLSVVPAGIKQVMEKALKQTGKSSAQAFYDIAIATMAADMAKGQPSIGHKIWIQFLALNNPQICAANLNKHATLKTSYQNRPPVGLSILWGLGQGGIKDFNVGFKVFKEFMRPMLEMKNYSKYIVKYLAMLLSRHQNMPMSTETYLYIYDLINDKLNVQYEISQDLLNLNKPLKTIILTKGKDDQLLALFQPMLTKLELYTKPNPVNELCDTLVTILSKQPDCFTAWEQIYRKNLVQSNKLLGYICDHWNKVSPKLNLKHFNRLIKSFTVLNVQLSSKLKSDPSLKSNVVLCERLIGKMTVTRSLPWKFVTFVLFATIVTLLTYDFNANHTWKQSYSVRTLKDAGLWEYGELAWDRAHQGLNWTKDRIELYAPGYIDQAHESFKPYAELSRDLGIILYNAGHSVRIAIVNKSPEVWESIDVLVGKSKEALSTFQVISVKYFNEGYHYLATQVFVGQLSPENMQKVMWQAINATQQYTVDCYDWVSEKVQTMLNGK